jgi:hypothetical protein
MPRVLAAAMKKMLRECSSATLARKTPKGEMGMRWGFRESLTWMLLLTHCAKARGAGGKRERESASWVL